MVVFGGENVHDLNDLYILNLEEQKWYKPNIDGIQPNKRRFHSSAILNKKLYIIAGCHSTFKCFNDIWEIDLENWNGKDSLFWN